MTFKDLIKLFTFPSLVYMFNTTFMHVALNFYNTRGVDTLSHFMGGLAIAFSTSYALSMIEKKNWIIIKKQILRAGIIIATTMAVAVLWEFYEFISDYFLSTLMQPTLVDTMKDLCLGMGGAIVFCLLKLLKK